MGLLDWLRKNRQTPGASRLAPPENYPIEEKRILLRVAGQIRAARGNPLDELMEVTLGLGSTIVALRRGYGMHAVQANCPAEQIIAGYSTSGNARPETRTRANELYDSLVSDLHAYEGDEMRTWMRMAWMLNPSLLEGALDDLEKG